jgi:hypothetical protein
MSRHGRLATAVALGGLAALPLASGAAAPGAFGVRSSLAAMTVLPHRIHWLATPSLPPGRIARVDFLVDGRVAWTEREAPYVFGEDERGHLGSLVTSYLSPGRHSFAVRAVAKDGRRARASVTARVIAPPAPPPALAGTWRRRIRDTSGAPEAGTPGNPTGTYTPAGTYTMVIERRWIRHAFPGRFDPQISSGTGEGWIITSDWTPGRSTLRVVGSVTRRPFLDTDAEGGWWCLPDGPPATYSWSVSGDALTLKPAGGTDPCEVRGFVWTGTWTRAG